MPRPQRVNDLGKSGEDLHRFNEDWERANARIDSSVRVAAAFVTAGGETRLPHLLGRKPEHYTVQVGGSNVTVPNPEKWDKQYIYFVVVSPPQDVVFFLY